MRACDRTAREGGQTGGGAATASEAVRGGKGCGPVREKRCGAAATGASGKAAGRAGGRERLRQRLAEVGGSRGVREPGAAGSSLGEVGTAERARRGVRGCGLGTGWASGRRAAASEAGERRAGRVAADTARGARGAGRARYGTPRSRPDETRGEVAWGSAVAPPRTQRCRRHGHTRRTGG